MIKRFLGISGRKQDKPVIIVSGLPRSGTSMMMKMLEAGGVPLLVDNIRTADPDNPEGYYEFERVKGLDKGDHGWLAEAQGQAVKVIAALLPYLPGSYSYHIIFMHRALAEILASQKKMLLNRGEDPDKVSDAELGSLYQKHLDRINTWLDQQPNANRIDMSYNQILAEPLPEIERIARFLGRPLNVEEMVRVVDPHLYRQRVQKV